MRPTHRDTGFTLIEVLIAMAITLIVMASVFALMERGQRSFRREPEVTDMTASARAGLERISRDLTMAGYNTPATLSIMWDDGGGINPDGVTIVYADPDIPVSRPMACSTGGGQSGSGGGPGGGGGPCNTIGMSSTLNIDPDTFWPPTSTPEDEYQDGMLLFAIQGPNGDPACDAMAPGIIPFVLTQPPKCTNAGGTGACGTLNLNHNPGDGSSEINPPGGFQNDVSVDCAVVGVFHVVQYRIDPPPPTASPNLERRDLLIGTQWDPVSANIENLQVQYSQGVVQNFLDVPAVIPVGGDPNSYITQVAISVFGRSQETNLEGSSAGVFAAEDTHLRRTFSTTMSLRNQLAHAEQKSIELGVNGWQ